MITVIVPVYNVEKYLSQCLDSILAQTERDLEIILIDDGSTDGSGGICDRYGETDARVRVFHTENRGLSAARNLGMKEAAGEYIGFVDGYGVEMDSYPRNSGDPAGKHFAIVKDRVSNHITYKEDDRVDDGSWHNMKVEYNKTAKRLDVSLDGTQILSATDVKMDDEVYMGLTAATGSGKNYHYVDDFFITTGTTSIGVFGHERNAIAPASVAGASDEEKDILKEYAKEWFSMLKKHPGTYLEATLAKTSGYYTLLPVIDKQKGGVGTTIQFGPDQLIVREVVEASNGTVSEKLIPESPESLKGAQEVLKSWYYFWLKTPVLNLFFKCGTYFLILMAVTIYYSKRKCRGIVLTIPGYFLLLMAIASPPNEHIRYVLPVAAALPLLICAAGKKNNA